MENNLLNTFSLTVTIVSSVVAIAAVSICSILSAYISQRGARKAKQTELLFQEMVAAYYDYLRASGEFSDPYSQEQITRYSDAFDRVCLFASKKTKSILCQHKEAATKTLLAKNGDREALDALAKQTGKVLDSLLHCMRKDLRK